MVTWGHLVCDTPIIIFQKARAVRMAAQDGDDGVSAVGGAGSAC